MTEKEGINKIVDDLVHSSPHSHSHKKSTHKNASNKSIKESSDKRDDEEMEMQPWDTEDSTGREGINKIVDELIHATSSNQNKRSAQKHATEPSKRFGSSDANTEDDETGQPWDPLSLECPYLNYPAMAGRETGKDKIIWLLNK